MWRQTLGRILTSFPDWVAPTPSSPIWVTAHYLGGGEHFALFMGTRAGVLPYVFQPRVWMVLWKAKGQQPDSDLPVPEITIPNKERGAPRMNILWTCGQKYLYWLYSRNNGRAVKKSEKWLTGLDTSIIRCARRYWTKVDAYSERNTIFLNHSKPLNLYKAQNYPNVIYGLHIALRGYLRAPKFVICST